MSKFCVVFLWCVRVTMANGYVTLILIISICDLSQNMTKPTKRPVRPAKTQISLGIHPVWSESSLSAWRSIGCLATLKVQSNDSDQTAQMHICHFIGFVMRSSSFNTIFHFPRTPCFLSTEPENYRIKIISYADVSLWKCELSSEPRHNKTNKMSVRPAKTQISLGICPVWSESSLCA